MSLHNYLESFRQAIEKIEDYGYTESVEIKEELRPNKQAVIKAKIVLIDRSVLHIREYIDALQLYAQASSCIVCVSPRESAVKNKKRD